MLAFLAPDMYGAWWRIRRVPPEQLPAELGERFLHQAWDLWVEPEIQRRRSEGRLPERFSPSKVQVIFNVEPTTPQVRFDDEVRAVASVRVNRPVTVGEQVMSNDVAEVTDIALTNLDPNAGHLTMLYDGRQWVIRFDFRRNATLSTQTLDAALEFLGCAAYSLRKRYLRAFVDNLYSAAELLAKALLLMFADKAFMEAKKHTAVARRYNLWGKLGNTDPRYVTLLNRLAPLRGPARYLEKDLELTIEEATDMLATAKDMLESLRASVPRRVRIEQDATRSRVSEPGENES